MKTTPNKKTPRPRVRRVLDKLLRAVDRQIAAADEAKSARDELVRLAEREEVPK